MNAQPSVLAVRDLFADIQTEPTNAPESFSETAYGRLRYLLCDEYGNELSEDHELVLRDGLIALADEMRSGRLSGRFAVGLPCGMGKTTGIRAILWAINELGLDTTVVVACYRVEQLCGLKRDLIEQDGIDPAKIGLMHSYEYNEQRAEKYLEDRTNALPPDHASEPSEGQDRQFLLVTHEAVKGEDRAIPEWLDRDLLFYDESLVVSEARVFTLLAETHQGLFDEINRIRDLAETKDHEKWGDAAQWMLKVKERLLAALSAVENDRGVHILSVPPLTGPVIKKLRKLLPERNWPNVYRLMDFANEDLRVRKDSKGHCLITYQITVPEQLKNVIITDASDPIRELVAHDQTIQRAERVLPGLAKYADGGLGQIKRFDNVTVYHRRASGGRDAMTQSFLDDAKGDLREVCKILDAHPDEEFLIFTYKEKDGVNFERLLSKQLGARRFDKDYNIRVHVLTWGNETALNDYAHIKNVIMLGVLLKPMEALAGQLMGQKRDLQDVSAGDEQTLQSLRYSEASHLVYQGANRGSMRFTEVDDDGLSQARECRLWVIHYDSELKTRLDRVMPGAHWQPWVYDDEDSRVYETALTLAEYLREEYDKGVRKVSSRAAKAAVDGDLSGTSWRRARDLALTMAPWHVDGQSLVATF